MIGVDRGVRPSGLVPVAITTRSDVDESVHHGAVVGLDSRGSLVHALGDPDLVLYPRSANKPIQAAAMVRLGLDLPDELLALVCASHYGSPVHVAGVERILASAGLDAAALRNTPSLPLERVAAEDVLRADGHASSLFMNCSGKHAGMLATCVVNGWPTEGYLSPEHPLQQQIAGEIKLRTGAMTHVGVDGCGAPAHVTTLRGLANAFRSIAHERGRVYSAMTTYPEMVGGPARDVSVLMRRVVGCMAKDGAEGTFALAFPDGPAVALKIGDGASRAAAPVALAALAALGVDVSDAEPRLVHHVLGHGEPVGVIRAVAGEAT